MSDREPSDDQLSPAAIGALSVAAVVAVTDWVACARVGDSRRWRRVEYVAKPGALIALVAAAATLDPAAGADVRRWWFVAALVCSLAGDVLLMLPGDYFVGGLSAFFVAHCCYIGGFLSQGPGARPLLIAVAGAAVAVGAVGRKVLGAVRAREPVLLGPVAAYVVVIGAMLAFALADANPAAAIGAILFVTSDSMIAWNRFVARVPYASVLIMVTYHLGQAGLLLSLLR